MDKTSEQFKALVAYASNDLGAGKLFKNLAEKDEGFVYDDLLDARKTSFLDLDLVGARVSGVPRELPQGHSEKVLNMCLDRLVEKEAFVSLIRDKDSSGGDIMQAYALLFDRKPIITVCEKDNYVDHPWIQFHSSEISNSFNEFGSSFREHVRSSHGEIDKRRDWMRSFLDLPVKEIGLNPQLYFAHASTHRDDVLTLQYGIGFESVGQLTLINPYSDLQGSDKDNELEDRRAAGEKVNLSLDQSIDIVHRDVGSIVECDGILVYLNESPITIGREQELVYGMLAGKQAMYGICTDKRLAEHPLIRAHLDHVLYYDPKTPLSEIAEDATPKILKFINDQRAAGFNKRVETYRQNIRERLVG
ncbi:MAG: hypothetical protein KC506_00255 [Nanoarchaeota archaeon]|nr:hypothetical protein [Nanoarchaeota archaeon]